MKLKKTLLITILILLILICGYSIYRIFFSSKEVFQEETVSESVEIPAKVLANKFGFLSGGEPENPFVGEVGGAWIRPHPGSFLWDSMQESEESDISFELTDPLIEGQQDQNYGTLVTLWPFAEWDQLNKDNPEECEVSENEQFLPQKSSKKGRDGYLPLHRCNPDNWEKYEEWVMAVVERYDGDGHNDMPGLEIPVKYWEVLNEPDITASGFGDDLEFFTEDEEAYGILLINTYAAIKEADPEAQVLIAGAAGADDAFLGYYENMFKNVLTHDAFDIGNIHCISNDINTHDFNVEGYKKLLEKYGIDKPIWVTEAESIISDNEDINASATLLSTQNAIQLGAERIFYTRTEFSVRDDLDNRKYDPMDITKTIDGGDSTEAYQEITGSIE